MLLLLVDEEDEPEFAFWFWELDSVLVSVTLRICSGPVMLREGLMLMLNVLGPSLFCTKPTPLPPLRIDWLKPSKKIY